MQILKVEVKPSGQKGTPVRVFARDDAGHILSGSGLVPVGASVTNYVLHLAEGLSVLAAEVTEEEDFDQKSPK